MFILKAILMTILLFAVTWLDPTGDAIRDMKYKGKEKQKMIEIGRDLCFALMLGVLSWNWSFVVVYTLAGMFLRISQHTRIYNKVAGYSKYYFGITSSYDRVMREKSHKTIKFNRWGAFVFAMLLLALAIYCL